MFGSSIGTLSVEVTGSGGVTMIWDQVGQGGQKDFFYRNANVRSIFKFWEVDRYP